MTPQSSPAPNPVAATADRHPLFYVGTMVYSKAGLAWLFMWLLWGDFCFTLMETVLPSIVPLRLISRGLGSI